MWMQAVAACRPAPTGKWLQGEHRGLGALGVHLHLTLLAGWRGPHASLYFTDTRTWIVLVLALARHV